ncbi:MAG: rRNA pseudouridine synthase [Lachnospiraceae bacterium]|nr:rRNA pseudouridine synthase [Lachnospiraceae bacterium]
MTDFIRLDKALSNMGAASRKEVKEAVRKGKILVNNIPATSSDMKITATDELVINGIPLKYKKYEYYMLNKPAGVISATTDLKEPTVTDLISSGRKDLFPVGRLDKDTVGLLVITNDGALAHELLSPVKHIKKTYFVRVKGRISEETYNIFSAGIRIGSEQFQPAELVILKNEEVSEAEITIYEGKYHQIKRMFEAVGNRVIYLKRLSMGNLRLDESLPEGKYRELSEEELLQLKDRK